MFFFFQITLNKNLFLIQINFLNAFIIFFIKVGSRRVNLKKNCLVLCFPSLWDSPLPNKKNKFNIKLFNSLGFIQFQFLPLLLLLFLQSIDLKLKSVQLSIIFIYLDILFFISQKYSNRKIEKEEMCFKNYILQRCFFLQHSIRLIMLKGKKFTQIFNSLSLY